MVGQIFKPIHISVTLEAMSFCALVIVKINVFLLCNCKELIVLQDSAQKKTDAMSE